MNARSEGDEVAEKTVWRAAERAQAYLTVRRARGASTHRVFSQIGGRSSGFMNNAGWQMATIHLRNAKFARRALSVLNAAL